jgi:outer membrane protein assembly factor BamB
MRPVVFGGMVYMNDGPLTMYALAASTGEVIWSVRRESTIDLDDKASQLPVFAVDANYVYMLRESYLLEAMNRHTGERVWKQRVLIEPPAAGTSRSMGMSIDQSRAKGMTRASPISRQSTERSGR